MYEPRKYDSGIIIEKDNKWIFRGQEIIQKNVLEFFQNNLREDEHGIYIENHYKQFLEMGYVQCKGHPLKIIDYHISDEGLFLEGNNGVLMPLKDFNFYTDENGEIFGIFNQEKYIKYKVNVKTISYLSTFMVEKEDKVFIQYSNIQKDIQPFHGNFEVNLPDFIL
ncbi:MAG: hypothetical protein H7A23_10665 [Leptospiraceae bacterium]|nr:hypothetical protein [Leptospiraceae bacterium]MCP5495007.1 hypothetical protein [Leptospiraceae bacterium]